MRAKDFPTTNYILCVEAFLVFISIDIWFLHNILHIFELPQYLWQYKYIKLCVSVFDMHARL